MSTEKFLVYFLLIAFYAVYAQFSDEPVRHHADRGTAVASMPMPTTTAKAAPDPGR